MLSHTHSEGVYTLFVCGIHAEGVTRVCKDWADGNVVAHYPLSCMLVQYRIAQYIPPALPMVRALFLLTLYYPHLFLFFCIRHTVSLVSGPSFDGTLLLFPILKGHLTMAITYITNADLLTSPTRWLVNTINCGYKSSTGRWTGTMGAGIARQFRDAYSTVCKQDGTEHPGIMVKYLKLCGERALHPGMMYAYQGIDGHRILNIATKDDWRNPSQLEWIIIALQSFVSNYERFGITAISFPPLGCGKGGLSWDDVGPLMRQYLGDLPIDIRIYISTDMQQF